MTLEMLTVPVEQAKRKLDAYRKELARRRKPLDDEISRLATAYERAVEGTPVIQLSAAIVAGGTFADGLPRVAIARSDRRRVTAGRSPWRDTVRCGWRRYDLRAPWEEETLEIGVAWPRPTAEVRGETIVPLVPPDALEAAGVGRSRLPKLLTLFEVEAWRPVPPVDPALLQHIAGDLYAVLATWDLTPLERAVIAGTR